ncbi:MAG: tetratricopeptide repeat protein [Planctomycetota bacterium]
MQVGPYRVLEEVARGGMGVVYRACAQDGTEVALKLLLSHRSVEAAARARFLAEVRVLARLRHPHVVAFLGAGEQEGVPWLALEFVRGPTLAERLRQGPLGIDDVRSVARDLVSALSYLHTCGVLHRDLKPDNVLLDGERARLTDFGLALDGDAEERLTRSGVLLGTPGYWPPEQVGVDRRSLGPASDIYGLGAVLYACLTGRAPRSASTLQEFASLEQTAAPITPPRQARPDVPRWLDALVMRCLARDPARRPASADALALALVQGPDAPRPRRSLAWAGLLGAPLSLAPLAWLLWSGPPPAPHAPSPDAPSAVVSATPTSTPLEDLEQLVARGAALRAAGKYAEARPLLEGALARDPQHPRANLELGIALEKLREPVLALEALDRARLLRPEDPLVLAARSQVLVALGRRWEALAELDEALRFASAPQLFWSRGLLRDALEQPEAEVLADFDRALELDPQHLGALLARGNLHRVHGRFAASLADYDHVLVLHPDATGALFNRGVVLRLMGRQREALASLDRLRRLTPDDPQLLLHRGVILCELRRSREALADLERACRALPDDAQAFLWRAQALIYLGRHAEALPAAQRAVQLQPDVASNHCMLGTALMELRRPAEALAALDVAVRLSPRFAMAQWHRGNALALLGRAEEAIEAYTRCLEAAPKHIDALTNRGVQLRRVGRLADALADYEAALELDPRNVNAALNRGNVLLDVGRKRDGLAVFEELLRRELSPDPRQKAESGRARALKLLGRE